MKKRLFLTIIAALLVFGAIFGYKFRSIHQAQAAMAARRPAPVTVTAAPAAAETWRTIVAAVGSVESFRGVVLKTEIEGRIQKIAFESGATVKAGDLLVELDSAAEQAQLKGLEARARLAQVTLARQHDLLTKGSNTQADVDTAEANFAQATAAIEELKATIAKKRIVAPFAGRLGLREIDPGQFLAKGDNIVALEAIRPAYFDFGLPQQEIARLQPGAPVRITVDAFPGQLFEGKIEAIAPRIGAETRNVRVRAVVENADEHLQPGMFGRIEVLLPEETAVVVLPATAVVYGTYGDSVYVLKEETPPGASQPQLVANQVFIQVGDRRGDQVAITEGIKSGDRVVTSGQMKLRNGVAVQVNNTVVPSNNPAPKPAES